MNLSPTTLAIPMYFTLMGVELIYESVTKQKSYRTNDTVTNISTGILSQLTATFVAIFKVGIYTFIYEQFSLYQLDQTWLTFFIAFIFWDLCYYWEHRMDHRISLFWGGHVVHHQSEEFNLSVALRQTSTGFLWGFPFYLPMAILGIHPMQFLLVGGINLLYQFWIHTEHIDRMPKWFEAVFNTPSHHRVHHGRDPKYIDTNYAGMLIIWDRMFGTFKQEEERPNYGITKPLKSWNPVYANFAHYIDLFQQTKEARTIGDCLRILFNPPGWLPDYMGGIQKPQAIATSYQKYNRQPPLNINIYILVQYAATIGITAIYLFNHGKLGSEAKLAYAIWIIVSTLQMGLLFEKRTITILIIEVLRLLSIPLVLLMLVNVGFDLPLWVVVLGGGFALGSIGVLLSLRQGSIDS